MWVKLLLHSHPLVAKSHRLQENDLHWSEFGRRPGCFGSSVSPTEELVVATLLAPVLSETRVRDRLRLRSPDWSHHWVQTNGLAALHTAHSWSRVWILSLLLVKVTTHRPLIGWGRHLGQLCWFARLGGGCYGGWAGLCWLTCDVSRDCVTVCWELSCVQCVTAMWHNVGCVSHLMCLCHPGCCVSLWWPQCVPSGVRSLTSHSSLSLLSQRSSRLSPGRRTGGRLPAQARLTECLNFFCRQH